MRHILLLIMSILVFSSCIKDYYYEEDPAFLTNDEITFIPYNQGDTLRLISQASQLTLIVDTVFNQVIDSGTITTMPLNHKRGGASIPYQDIECRYYHFSPNELVSIVVAPEQSIAYSQFGILFKDVYFWGNYRDSLRTVSLNNIVYDSVYVIRGKYPDLTDTLWYSRNEGIIGVSYNGDYFWQQN